MRRAAVTLAEVGIVAGLALNTGIMGVAWGRLTAGQAELKKDMTDVRKALGLDTGNGSAFVRKSECGLMEDGVSKHLQQIEKRLDLLDNRAAEG